MTIKTNSKQGLPQPGLDAAREGRTIHGYVNEKSGINSEAALTDATFIQNIESGYRYIITQGYMHLGTDTDSVKVEFGVTSEASGSGDFTALTCKYEMETGTQTSEVEPNFLRWDPPLCVTKDDGECFTARVLGNDAGAELTLEYHGWREDAS